MILALNVCFACNIRAQGWVSTQTGEGTEVNSGMCTDPNGMAYLVTSYDPSRETRLLGRDAYVKIEADGNASAATDVAVSKFNPSGDVLWTVLIKGKETVFGFNAHFGKDGFLYVGGNYNYDARFEGTRGNVQYLAPQSQPGGRKLFRCFFLAKYSTEGELIWVRTGHSDNNTMVKEVVADDSGNAYAWIYATSSNISIGDFTLITDRRSGMYVGRYYAIIAKYNASGEEQWLFYTGDEFYPRDLLLDSLDRPQLIGRISDQRIVFQSTTGESTIWPMESNRNHEVWLSIDQDGHIAQHEEAFPAVSIANLQNVQVLDDGYLVTYHTRAITISTRGICIDGDTIWDTTREFDAYFVRFNAQKEVMWYASASGPQSDFVHSVTTHPNGDLVACFTATGQCVVRDSERDTAAVLSAPVYTYLAMLHFDRQGRLVASRNLGLQSNKSYDVQAHASFTDDRLWLTGYFTLPSTLFGHHLGVPGSQPGFEHHGGPPESVLASFPMSNDSEGIMVLNGATERLQSAFIQIYAAMGRARKASKKPLKKLEEGKEASDTQPEQNLSAFVFPNPVPVARRRITIRLSQPVESVNGVLMDQNGSVVQQQVSLTMDSDVEVTYTIREDLPPGLYILSLVAGNKAISKKLILL